MNEIKIFTAGGLNYDTELHLLPKDDWIDAINVRMAASDEQEEGAASNIEGNVRIGNYSYAAGTNICIGAYADEFRNVIIACICNTQNRDEIIEIDPVNGIITPIFKNIVWTGAVDVTQFEPWIKIPSMDIIHRADDEGDLLFWTDGNSRPRKINIRKSKAYNTADGYPDPILMSYTLVAKEPPPSPSILGPTYGYWSDFTRTINNLRGKLFQFQIRYVYDDFEKSTWSGWANFDIPTRPFDANRDSDPAIDNKIFIGIFTGGNMVKEIEIAVRQNNESIWGDAYLFDTLDKVAQSIDDNVVYSYPFLNDTSGVLQTPAEVNQVWDFVPTKAGSQALVNGNTLVYGDITEGLRFDGALNVTIVVSSQLLSMQSGDNEMAWKLWTKYRLGLVYFDEFNRTDGVHTYFKDDASDDDFEVNTPRYQVDNNSSDAYNIARPVLTASIFHQPPIWARSYKWVRTKPLTYSNFLYYVAFAIDTPDSSNIYFDMNQVYDSIIRNGQSALSYDFTPGDRLRVIRQMATDVPPYVSASGVMYNIDLEIIALLTNPVIVDETFTGRYLKVRRNTPSSTMGPALYLIEIYTPSKINDTTEFFYEFGAEYPIIAPGDPINMAHGGMLQNQNPVTGVPATFSFTDGDVYRRPREAMEYQNIDSDPQVYLKLQNIPIEDPSFSDKYPSAVNGNGRAYIVDDDQKEQRLPSFIRFGGAYIQDTFINRTNNFPATNFVDNCSRAFGAIKRLTVRDRQLRVFQELKCGWIPISQSVLQTTEGSAVVSQSEQLLNNIQYYEGDFGIGNAPCSLASKNFADYFHDTNRGVICRLSRDGITPISITAKMNRFAIVEDLKYKATVYLGTYPAIASDIPGRAQIYGVFDTKNNTYISAYEEIAEYPDLNRVVVSPPKTMSWDEVRNRFISPYKYYPEWMTSLKNDVITFKGGIPYIHNDKVNRCRFYGVNYDWGLEMVFNDKFAVKKTFLAIDELSNVVLACPSIITSLSEPGSSVLQLSNLIEADFTRLEEHFHAAFLRDINSPGGILNGDFLKGGYIRIQLYKVAAQALISLHSVGVKYIVSQLNNQ
jgi:hypothetical protein